MIEESLSYYSKQFSQMRNTDHLEWDAFRNEAPHSVTFKYADKYETVLPGEIVMIPRDLKYIVAKRGLPFAEVDVTFAYSPEEYAELTRAPRQQARSYARPEPIPEPEPEPAAKPKAGRKSKRK